MPIGRAAPTRNQEKENESLRQSDHDRRAAVSIATAPVVTVELARVTGELTPAWLDRNLENSR